MPEISYFLVDVFTEEKFSGNQLAVFLNANELNETQMQKIAKEMNLSEITFIMSENIEANLYKVRIFTPEHEVDFAGHPSIGTVHVIRNLLREDKPGKIVLDLKAGNIPVTCSTGEGGSSIYWMKQIEPVFGQKLNVEAIAPILGIPVEEFDAGYPIEEVSTGLPHVLVPLKTLDSLKKIVVNKGKYFNLINKIWAKNILVFCPEAHNKGRDISVRMFADYLGIPEDPATGSGNGCLAGYMAKYRYFGNNKVNIISEQGFEIGRPSLLYLKAEDNNGKIDIYVGGNAVIVAKGTLYI